MKDFHPPLLDIMAHYASVMEATAVQAILAKRSVDNASEARVLREFVNAMSDRIADDAKRGVSVLEGETVATSDAVKVWTIVDSYLEELGYDDPTSEDE